MPLGSVDGLIYTAASGNDTQGVAVHEFLRSQEGEGGIDVARHLFDDLFPLLLKIGELAALAGSEPAKIEGENVISRGAQHRSELIVDLTIGVTLVQQKKARSRLAGRIE